MYLWILALHLFTVTTFVESGVVQDVKNTEQNLSDGKYVRGKDYDCATLETSPEGSFVLCLAPYTRSLDYRPSTKKCAVLYFKKNGKSYQLQILDIAWGDGPQNVQAVKDSVKIKGFRGTTLLVNFWKAVKCVYVEYEWIYEKGFGGRKKNEHYHANGYHEKPPQNC